jgi:hypothetical protein
MDKLSQKIKIELENIDSVINELPSYSKLPSLSTLELAGVAALLHNFYNGIENILKQILASKNLVLPEGKSWHKDLLETVTTKEIISNECKNYLGQYLAFRHFFSHAYALDLYPDKMEPLVENLEIVYSFFKKEIEKFLQL